MPICIECCYPVPQLYHVLHSRGTHAKTPTPTPKPSVPNLSKPNASGAKNAGESALKGKSAGGSVGIGAGGGGVVGSDVRLTQCPRCKRFADKYVEHDYVVLFIDLVLVKPQVSPTQIPPHNPTNPPKPQTLILLPSPTGLPAPPLQPLQPNIHDALPLHPPPRHPPPPLRRLPNLVTYRIAPRPPHRPFAHPAPQHIPAIPLLPVPLQRHDARAAPDDSLAGGCICAWRW